MLKLAPMAAATRSNTVFSALMSRYWPSESQSRGTFSPGDRCHSIASRSACGYGNGRSRSALATPKIALVAPMPIVSESNAAIVKPGASRRVRTLFTGVGLEAGETIANVAPFCVHDARPGQSDWRCLSALLRDGHSWRAARQPRRQSHLGGG